MSGVAASFAARWALERVGWLVGQAERDLIWSDRIKRVVDSVWGVWSGGREVFL